MSIFSKVQASKPKHNIFDLSHDVKFNTGMGYLIPTLVHECVPGDSYTCNSASLVRFSPLIAPMMHEISVYHHYFFVPNRILWDNWESFITGGEDGDDTSVFPTVQLTAGSDTITTYFGIPNLNPSGGSMAGEAVNALPFAAYNRIFNEFFRDQNLIPKNTFIDKVTDGNNDQSIVNIAPRAHMHDYFTSALPWVQKGAEATIPMGNITEASFIDPSENWRNSFTQSDIRAIADTDPAGNTAKLVADGTGTTDEPIQLEVGSTTIIELRRAFKLQEWLEKNARGGSRYIESILSHFGVKSSDARLQRPQYLGGSATPVSVSEVLQTSSTDDTTPQGNMSGHAISAGSTGKIKYSCEEHGFIIALMSVRPKTAYQQGIHKMWHKFDKFDYYWPSFAHIGEQPILNKEVYYDQSDDENDDVFGYTPRYAEYKYINSRVAGSFRDSLDFWHAGRIFSGRPYLNGTFVSCSPSEYNRLFAVDDSESGLNLEQMYVHTHHSIKARRPMPYFGNPQF